MIIKQKETTKEEISKESKVFDYPMPSDEHGVSLQKLNGRVPDSGSWKNKVCREICYVLKGRGVLVVDNKEFSLEVGDVFIVEPNQTSYIQADNLEMVTFTSPNWISEQCELVY